MLENSLGYLLNTASRLIKRDLDLQLRKYDLTTAQWALLYTLSIENNLSQAEIAEKTSSDRATVGSVIDKLINKKLICKKLCESDRRSYIVSICEEGQKIVEKVENYAVESNMKAIQGLSNEEVEILTKCLKAIIENFKE